jgi:site-specific DNA-methyltransferase (adenine-specific)
VSLYYDNAGITIYHGDAREVLPALERDSIDLVLTDPPYQSLDVDVSWGSTTRLVSRDRFNGKRLAAADGMPWFGTMSFDDLDFVWAECRKLLRNTGALYVFTDVKSGIEINYRLRPRNVIVWDKQKIGMGYAWRRTHEWIAYCPNQKHKLRCLEMGDIVRASGISKKVHPTEKPPSVCSPIIRNSSDSGARVLDPFMGVGSILIAAKLLGRSGIGIEIEERYCEIAARRLAQDVLPFSPPPAAPAETQSMMYEEEATQ